MKRGALGKGKVYLVGAGPGDPGLLTVKAARLIREADLIVYDTLANPDHLRGAKKTAAKICVGRRFRYRPFSQQRINRLIINAVRRGQTVVRLKGGDPYLFGRGGEEGLFLAQRKISFQVVPGVTSATACAAYAGIPLTHREHNASVTFLTGHRAHDDNLDSIHWKNVVALGGTLVIYMGFYNLGKIARRLIQYGMPDSTPAAVIQWGTLPKQKSCEGTLATIERRVREEALGAPSIIIVGDVVSLRRRLNWFEKLPLFGKTVIVTRSQDKASILREKLEEKGARVLEFPTIEINQLLDPSALRRALKVIAKDDWIVFTSAYGVDAFFKELQKTGKDARRLGGVRLVSVGPQTTESLRQYGIMPDLEPSRFETRAIVEALKKKYTTLEGIRFWLFRTDIAPPDLEKGLKALGGEVRRVTAYRTVTNRLSSPEIKSAINHNEANVVTFTSSSTVAGFVNAVGLKYAHRLARKVRLASIGPVTTRTLRCFGLRPSCEARVFTIDGLVNAIVNMENKHR